MDKETYEALKRVIDGAFQIPPEEMITIDNGDLIAVDVWIDEVSKDYK